MAFNLCVAEAAAAAGSNVSGGLGSFGSLLCMLEQPSSEKSNLIETLSSLKHQIIPVHRPSSCKEIFGEMDFDEARNDSPRPVSLFPSAAASPVSFEQNPDVSEKDAAEEEGVEDTNLEECSATKKKKTRDESSSFAEMDYESLQMCTEGLGSESSYDDVEVEMAGNAMHVINTSEHLPIAEERRWNLKSGRGRKERGFPPPISSIGKSERPSVSFKSYREEGRFILKEVRNPAQEFCLHASRENGRLTLRFVRPDDNDDDHDYLRHPEDDYSSDEVY